MPGVGVLIALAAGYWIFKKHPVKKVSQVHHFKGSFSMFQSFSLRLLGGVEWGLGFFCQRSVQIGKVALTRTRRVPYCCQAQGYDIKNSTMQIDPTNKETNISEPFGKMYVFLTNHSFFVGFFEVSPTRTQRNCWVLAHVRWRLRMTSSWIITWCYQRHLADWLRDSQWIFVEHIYIYIFYMLFNYVYNIYIYTQMCVCVCVFVAFHKDFDS